MVQYHRVPFVFYSSCLIQWVFVQEGYKCHIEENCAETFPSQAELAEHIKAHKEELKKRLICPYDTSR